MRAARHQRSERRLRRAVALLSGCLGGLPRLEERVLVLRAGVGRARPHSRRAVARRLDMRVRRVRKLERRGLRTARALARSGACSSGSGSAGAGAGGGSALTSGGGGALIPPPPAPERVGGGAGSTSTDTAGGSSSLVADGSPSGDVRGESETQLPSPIDTGPGRRVEPGGLSLGIGVGLILLALLAGYATPHLRARLRSGRPA